MALATVAIFLAVYFKVIAAEPLDHFVFSVDHTGLFVQENPGVNANPPDYNSLGLVNRTYSSDASFDPQQEKTQWERFGNFVDTLNKASGVNTQYKLVYMARHAEGWHNVAEKVYPGCWDCYWSQQDGDGNITWRDAALSTKGVQQTAEANKFWKGPAQRDKIPYPQKHYVSPMTRTMQTANYTWSDHPNMNLSKGFFVKEALREAMYQCTCSARHPKSSIPERFPQYHVDPEMTEQDTLWHAGKSEPESSMKARANSFLAAIFDAPETYISATSHGVLIGILLGQIGHPNPNFPMGTAQNIPLLIRGDRVPGKAQVIAEEPYGTVGTCGRCADKAQRRRVAVF